MANKNNKPERISNVNSSRNNNSKTQDKVNNGVFIYSGSLTCGELAKQLNIPVSDIVKYFFMKKKMVNFRR